METAPTAAPSEHGNAIAVLIGMDICAEIHALYRDAYRRSGNQMDAHMAAYDRFADLAGYAPPPQVLDKLLRGALLGRDHLLMKLLDQPTVRARS